MIRLYTAVGTFKFNKHGLPTIVCADREYGLTSMELVLWSCLSFRILTYDELRKEFYEKERELHVLSEEEFDQCVPDYNGCICGKGCAFILPVLDGCMAECLTAGLV